MEKRKTKSRGNMKVGSTLKDEKRKIENKKKNGRRGH